MRSDHKNNNPYSVFVISAVIILCGAVGYLGIVPQQSHFYKILPAVVVAFTAYAYMIKQLDSISLLLIIGSGILVRAIMIFAFPQLSDDIYRFLWDGYLSVEGTNPYGYLPSDIIAQHSGAYPTALYTDMNSPSYYTIYPPFAQLIFYLANLCAPTHIPIATMLIKTCFFVAEICTLCGLLKILSFLKKDQKLIAIYFLNPLIIVEGLGNLHFEIIMISFLVWAIYYIFVKRKMTLGAVLMALSIATKLLPLMFLPYFLFHLKGRDRMLFFTVGFLSLIMLFSPIAMGLDFANFGASIDLYFQKFEFNAGLYYILRALGQAISGYNLIHYLGPLLGVSTLFLILYQAYRSVRYDLSEFSHFALIAFTTYLLFATTVHPWYLCVPICLSVFSSYRYVLVWSGLILLTYINYSYTPYYENLWIVGLEYAVIYALLYYAFVIGSKDNTDLQSVTHS